MTNAATLYYSKKANISIACMMMIVCLMSCYMVYTLAPMIGHVAMIFSILAFTALGLWSLYISIKRIQDPSPQVVIDSTGIRLLRKPAIHIAWQHVKDIKEYRSSEGNSVVVINLHSTETANEIAPNQSIKRLNYQVALMGGHFFISPLLYNQSSTFVISIAQEFLNQFRASQWPPA